MFCQKCGAENDDEKRFCRKCGNALDSTDTTSLDNLSLGSKIANALKRDKFLFDELSYKLIKI